MNRHIDLDSIQEIFQAADRITALTGAGISAESGIPTFRDAQTGIWEKYDPEELATPEAFLDNPILVWKWYLWRRELINKAKPNKGHLALAMIEHNLLDDKRRWDLITQNVDGLHQQAGSLSVIEIHGNIQRDKCFNCENSMSSNIRSLKNNHVPRCPLCRGMLRPDVVWFGESIPHIKLESALKSTKNCDVFMVIGTSAIVQPAAALPLLAKQNGATVIEVNKNQTPITPYIDIFLPGTAGKILPKLAEALFGNKINLS